MFYATVYCVQKQFFSGVLAEVGVFSTETNLRMRHNEYYVISLCACVAYGAVK